MGGDSKSGDDSLTSFLAAPVNVIDGFVIKTEELKRFYALRDNKPIWDTSPKGNRDSLKAFLSSVTAFEKYHGLVEENYPAAQMSKLIDSKQDSDSAKIEILVTAWLLKLAHDLHGDGIKLEHLYAGWTYQRQPGDMVAGFTKAVDDGRIYDFISDLGPSNPAYLQLARALKAYRAIAENNGWVKIPEGLTIRPGERDSRIQQVRDRLKAEKYVTTSLPEGADPLMYDDALKAAVENYQGRNGLQPDGNLGGKTVDTMNVPVGERIDQIQANMERWRHMPETPPARRVIVNIAEATVEVMDDGKSIYRGPVVVGRRDRKTPFIQSAIRSVIFNPSWHVPTKIARKDILPKLRNDPHYLEKMGFVINGSADDPHGEAIDWNTIEEGDFNFHLRQSPGDVNSLGRLKFDFDNDFAVYMHGTPHKELFEKAERNQSSGCVRLRDPDQFAVLMLKHAEGDWTLEKVQAEVDKRKTRWLKIDDPIPVMFVYWTAFSPEDEGPLNFRRDVYNYDAFLMETLRDPGSFVRDDKTASLASSRFQSVITQ
jgi:L,D-transpeptidase YcbB